MTIGLEIHMLIVNMLVLLWSPTPALARA